MMKPARQVGFLLLCVLIGALAGLGAVVFRMLIALVHNAFFFGTLSLSYDVNVHTSASPWGPFIALAPVIAAVAVTFLVTRFAPEAGGTGVPEVMAAIFYTKGAIRPVVSLVKALASSLSIGSGGSAGREGPIMLIGSAFGPVLGRIFSLSPWQKITLIACGAGGGIAATYDTPIGGVLFVAEILLHEVSVRTLVPLALSTAAAATLGRVCWGDASQFVIPLQAAAHTHAGNLSALADYAGLGLIAGISSAVFIWSAYSTEDFFNKHVKGGPYTRHLAGMLLVGVMIYLMMVFFGRYYIEGVGYATIQDVLAGRLSLLPLLVLLFALKLFATSVTLGSGGSGGIFSPALFLGATLAGALGTIVQRVFPGLMIDPAVFALAGMAAMVGGTTGAATAAIVMILEMTHGYSAAIPVTIAVACSIGVRRAFSRDSMYTLKLARQGRALSDTLLRDVHDLRHEEK